METGGLSEGKGKKIGGIVEGTLLVRWHRNVGTGTADSYLHLGV